LSGTFSPDPKQNAEHDVHHGHLFSRLCKIPSSSSKLRNHDQ
jgi:hypothetical protein